MCIRDSVQAEPTFERLRYLFGGDRPSQTARLTMSPDPVSYTHLDVYKRQGMAEAKQMFRGRKGDQNQIALLQGCLLYTSD